MDWSGIQQAHRAVADYVLADLRPAIENAAGCMVDCLRGGGKILLCGNGGSAADAQHFAGELVNQFLIESDPWPAIALTVDSAVMTSIANDYSHEVVFEKQVRALGRPGDVLVAISTSGTSENIVRAVDAANAQGLVCVGLLGGAGGTLQDKVAHPLTVACSDHTPRIQEGHLIIIHCLCEIVEATLSAEGPS